MAEYIEKKKLVNSLKMWLMDLENDMDKGDYGELCENKGAREAVESCICEAEEQPAADVQPLSVVAEHIKKRLYETALNTREAVASSAIADMAERIDFWIDELKGGDTNV